MWTTAAENSALFLGLALSAYTIYTAVEHRLTLRRQRYAWMRRLRIDAEYFVNLAKSLSHRAEQVKETFAPNPPPEGFPSPAAEKDSLPEESLGSVQWLVARAEHLLAYPLPIDLQQAGSMLTRPQVETLLKFITSYRAYTQVLATRTFDLKMFPRKMGALYRFAGVAYLNIAAVSSDLDAFGASLGEAKSGGEAVS